MASPNSKTRHQTEVNRAEAALRLAIAAAVDGGFDARGAVVHRVANSVLVRLPAAGVMARIDRADRAEMVAGHVAVARLLEDLGVPAVRLAARRAEPTVTPTGVVTLWRYLTFDDRSATPEEIGAASRRLHEATAGIARVETPTLDPFFEVALWLQTPAAVDSPRIAELLEMAAQLQAQWDDAALSDTFARVIVHGDLNRDNVVATADGPVLLDLECAGYGPAAWDLVAQWVAVLRYGRPESEYERFCAVYGADVRESAECELLRRVYELSLTAWAAAHSRLSPQLRAEATVRIRSLLDSESGQWSLL